MKVIEKKLIRLYQGMLDDDRHALIRYAEFLYEKRSDNEEIKDYKLAEPLLTSAKENETVVGALKRLTASYPMIDKSKMLDQTSTLMSDHLLRGKTKKVVIQEFEALFKAQYEKLRENYPND